MIFHPARVAPEKAVIRPALPTCFLPGISEMQMATKLTYSEQLKHPNWQRKRLSILERDGWKCVTCQADEKTLHVHHKTYIKGRSAWDYEDENFESLCEDCHEIAHSHKARMDEVLAQYPSEMWGALASLLIGFGEDYVDPEFWLHIETNMARAGQLAWFAMNFNGGEIVEVKEICCQIGPHRVIDALRAECKKDFEGAKDA